MFKSRRAEKHVLKKNFKKRATIKSCAMEL